MRFFAASLFKEMLIVILSTVASPISSGSLLHLKWRSSAYQQFFLFSFLQMLRSFFLSARFDGLVEIDPNKIIRDAIISSARLPSSLDGGLFLLNSSI
jgi:hypothetical protein